MVYDLQVINNMVRRNFRPIWKADDREAAFKLVNRIRVKCKLPTMDRETFDKGYQYRTIFHAEYRIAKEEFVSLISGLW